MYALTIALLGAMLVAWNFSISEPREIAFRQQAEGQAIAENFWAYRSALVRYNNANPAVTDKKISDQDLTPHFLAGFVRVPQSWTWAGGAAPWSNYVCDCGTLYTYSTKPLPATVVDAITKHGGRTLMIGIAQSSTSMRAMSTLDGGAVDFMLPAAAAIPAGAVVVIGN